jgi:hypothetical protein
MRRPQFTPKLILWYLFLLESAKDRRATEWGLEHFQGPRRESNSECPVLWPSASNNRVTVSPHDAIHSSYNSPEKLNFTRSEHGEGNIKEFLILIRRARRLCSDSKREETIANCPAKNKTLS